MKTNHSHFTARLRAPRGVALAVALVALGGCAFDSGGNPAEGIGFREARFEEISAMQSYRKCRDDALELDSQARATGNPGRYLASARLLEKCEAELGPEVAGAAEEERMRGYALSIQNYVKGGDVETARQNLDRFREAFPGRDIYFTDGSSFIETMAALVGEKTESDFGRYSMLNVNETLKEEMRRVSYWKRN